MNKFYSNYKKNKIVVKNYFRPIHKMFYTTTYDDLVLLLPKLKFFVRNKKKMEENLKKDKLKQSEIKQINEILNSDNYPDLKKVAKQIIELKQN